MRRATSRLWETPQYKWSGVFNKYIPTGKRRCPYSLPSLHQFFPLLCESWFWSISSQTDCCHQYTAMLIFFPSWEKKKTFSRPDWGHQCNSFLCFPLQQNPSEILSIIASSLSPLIISRKHSKQVFSFITIALMNVTNGLDDTADPSDRSLGSVYLNYQQNLTFSPSGNMVFTWLLGHAPTWFPSYHSVFSNF